MKLLIATTNQNKIKEYRLLFKGSGLRLFNLPKLTRVAETGKTFKANAILKARAYGTKYSCPVLADDSGLEVKALRGFPGIYSNRFANGDFNKARKELLRRLKGQADRRARFVCVIALYLPDKKKIETFTGAVKGRIAAKAKKHFGFGYDPIFIYPGPKMQVSHRGRATEKLIAFLKKSM